MRLLCCGLLVAAFALVGCSSGPRIAPVKGRVTCGGTVVTSGTITFHSDTGRVSLGEIQPDGSYTLTTTNPGDGGIVGQNSVTIMATKVGGGSAGYASFEEELKGKNKITIPGKIEWLVPEIYSRPETTTLKAEVEDKLNEINFEIPK